MPRSPFSAVGADTLTDVVVLAAVAAVIAAIPAAPYDWGDDFAMYVMQAADFAGDHRFRGLFVPNSDYGALWFSPAAYPPGFPLLLAPVYAVAGANLPAMQLYMSGLLALLGYIVYRYGRTLLGHRGLAAGIALVVILHVMSLDLRRSILSDIPFTSLVLLFLWAEEAAPGRAVSAALAVAAWLVRTAGSIVIVAWLAEAVYRLVFERQAGATRWRQLGMAAAAAAAMRLLSWALVDTQGYAPDFREWLAVTDPMSNVRAYWGLAWYYFGSLVGFQALPIVLPALAALFAVGAAAAVREGRRLSLWFFAAYLGLLAIYPYHQGGFRMILPVLPLIWIHAARGALLVGRRFSMPRWAPSLAAVALALLACRQVQVFGTQPMPPAVGPESPEAGELVAYLEATVAPDALTLSPKPRALALFARRPGTTLQPDAGAGEVEQLIARADVRFVVCGTPFAHPALDAYCRARTEPPVFRNAAFAVYRTGR